MIVNSQATPFLTHGKSRPADEVAMVAFQFPLYLSRSRAISITKPTSKSGSRLQSAVKFRHLKLGSRSTSEETMDSYAHTALLQLR